MKKIFVYSSILLAGAFVSCVSESPFSSGGEGALRMKMVMRGDLTRAEGDADADLASNCKVLISKVDKGLLYKYEGVSSIPDRLMLSTGSYVAEGYAGDSVSASWDKKFYKGRREFQIQSGVDTEVSLVCGIANVVTAINGQDMDPNMIKDWNLTVGHSRADLEFTQDNIDDKGYFMMPSADWNSADGTDLGSLHYTITGKDGNGKEFEPVTGTIDNVKPAHQYTFNVHFGLADVSSLGGGYISLKVEEKDIREMNDSIIFFGPPAILSVTEGIDLDSPVTFAPNAFPIDSLEIGIKSHKELASLHLAFSPNEKFGLADEDYDVLSYAGHMALVDAKIGIKDPIIDTIKEEDYQTHYISFSKEFLDKLGKGTYYITVTATDQGETESKGISRPGKTTVKMIELVVDNAKVLIKENSLKVRSYSAQMNIQVNDKEVTNAGVQYRVKGQDDWTVLFAKDNVVKFSGLTPETTYEVQAIADDYVNDVSTEFTTEGIFIIPNASFEEWSTYKASTMLVTKTVILPSNTGNKETSFWGSGNEGSATANITLTDKFEDIKHSGKYSARLESKSAFGIIAAGNIFIGKYDKTDGTNGVLQLGRKLNVLCHPTKLVAWANYRPASGVTVKPGNQEFVPEGFDGGTDHGQIYVALTDEPIEIRTNPNNRKLMDLNDPHVLAYGEITWTDNFGADGTLERIEIPITYIERKKANDDVKRENTNNPLYLVMVASASKYGDYFSGAAGSVLILDDFELVYE